MISREKTDVAVIGAGYYGAFVASEIKSHRPDLDVTILEREDKPFTQAASTNQGQFHMGYFYSGDLGLAQECVDNIERFSSNFGNAVDENVTSFYAIHRDSTLSDDDYEAFCNSLGIPLGITEEWPQGLYGDDIHAAFTTAEKTFNNAKLQKLLLERLTANGVKLTTGFNAQKIEDAHQNLRIVGDNQIVEARQVFNVTFADINGLHERSTLPLLPVRHDTLLHFVLELPGGFESISSTVIKGPYASLMASSYRHGHILASAKHRKVRTSLTDKPPADVSQNEIQAKYVEAIADAVEYMPILGIARYKGYTLGTRTALVDPGTGSYSSKATVFEDFGGVSNYHAVLAGKVSCMFDVAEPIRGLVS